MYALSDSYDMERDCNHERKAKIRAERRNLFANTKSCDRCEGFGTLIDLLCEVDCDHCDGLGRVKILEIVR